MLFWFLRGLGVKGIQQMIEFLKIPTAGVSLIRSYISMSLTPLDKLSGRRHRRGVYGVSVTLNEMNTSIMRALLKKRPSHRLAESLVFQETL